MKKRGISLIVLVITIIVILILAGIVIFAIGNSGILDKSKKARFMNDYTSIQEIVNVYAAGKYNATTGEFELPLKGDLTDSDKSDIISNVPTLKTKIEELSGPIDAAKLAWIDSSAISATLSKEKEQKGYIIDVTSGQIYDYIGDFFEGKRWHTLDGGVTEGTPSIEVVELWDGWINLTLYYPANSTDKKWRLGTEGEVRSDPITMWQNYTGPIRVPLDRVKDVWIKYKVNGIDVIIPPAGTLLVDIVPDTSGTTKVFEVNVSINYDSSATTKEYRVGNSGWMPYTVPFKVTENCMIEARANKTETIYNTDGTVLANRDIVGKDYMYIGNIGTEGPSSPGGSGDPSLAAPTIIRLAPGDASEVAKVQITYPANADKKIYKENYGVEQNYTTEISVKNYGEYIIAYYYDASSKKSLSTSIYINDTTGGALPKPASPHEPSPPVLPGDPPPLPPADPKYPPIVAPTINVSPTAIATETQVSVSAPANADKVYIKLGRYGTYEEYTAPITVRENMEVYAYYVTNGGEKSEIAHKAISNIKIGNKPYVYIDASPYPWTGSSGASAVTVTINYSDTTSIEYSEDGIVYKPYTAPLTVTKNETIYARGKNVNGVTETSLNITNIGKVTPPTLIKNLAVSISVNPEPTLATTKIAKDTVTIDYDTAATEKYYTIGTYGALQTYTGPFDVTSNCTIYAYAKGTDSKGQTYKTIDNLLDGIAEPAIKTTPNSTSQASKVSVAITYDKYATIKQYSLDGGPLRDYTAAFDVSTNGTVVYAYSVNAAGQKSNSSYTIQNIVPEPPMLLLDKGDYYLLKLNYPTESKGREYKWKTDGTWTAYKDAGIMLIKPQFKDKVIKSGTLVKIEDENGNMVTFTGDYYLIDVPISELFENISMRWDREPLSAPQIVLNTTEPALKVTASITYPAGVVKPQYKILKPGEVSTNWQDYTGPITIDKNNTVIYARGMDDTEVWSIEGIKKVTNIDEVAPVIKLTADLTLAQQKVPVRINVTDDVAVGLVKWAPGIQGESYFTTSGTEIPNDSIVNITENGYYTFYAEDRVGNKQVYTLNVTNVDLTAPVIDIAVTPENTVGLSATVTINYGDSTTKQYKVGTSNSTWTNYTTAFAISSYTVLSNNWQNADGSVTIYAKGKDTAGNEVTVQKKVLSLDLDKPIAPVITSNAGYPVLASYGVTVDGTTTIVYDNRTDIDNYYSTDSGSTWKTYTGSFDMTSGTVIAKSVKKSTALEVSVSKTITMPADAMQKEIYDGNDLTSNSTTIQYMLIDSFMQGKNVRIRWCGGQSGSAFGSTIRFLDANKTEITNVVTIGSTIVSNVYNIPANAKWIKFEAAPFGGNLYEIGTSNEPTFSGINGYMLLTSDSLKAIREPYQMVTPSYFTTSVQRLYRIGTTGNWLNYNDQPVKVSQSETIYAKGIDAYGKETRIISSYTVDVPDAMKKEVYDGNDSTYNSTTNQYMQIDSSMQGRNVRIRWCGGQAGSAFASTIKFLNDSKQEISNVVTIGSTIVNNTYIIPTNAKYIKFEAAPYGGNLYEIQPSNEVRISCSPTNWTNDIVNVTIDPLTPNYITKYSYDSVNWYTYTYPLLIATNNTTIYAKSLDYSGNAGVTKTLTVTNIDKIKPTIIFNNKMLYSTNGKVYGSIMVGANDTGGSAINNVQYVLSNQNYSAPSSGWNTCSNGAIVINELIDNISYLWVKVTDNAGNVTISVSNKFDKSVDKIYTLTNPTSVTDNFDTSTLNSAVWGTYAHNAGSQVTVESNQSVIKNFYGYGWTGGGIYTKQTFPATGQLTVEYDWQPGTCYVSSLGFGVAYFNPSSFTRESYYGEPEGKYLSQLSTYGGSNPDNYVRLTYNSVVYTINLNTWTKYHITEILDFKNGKYQYFINGNKIVDSALTSTILNGIGSNFRVEFYKGNYQATSNDKIDNISIKSETFN